MKNQNLLGIILALFTVISYAQSGSDTQRIGTTINELYAAMVDKDREPLENLTAEKLSYGHSSGTIENKDQYVDAVLEGPFDYISIDPVDQQIEVSGDTSIVRHIFVAKGTIDGEQSDVRIGVMMTFQKLDGQWKLLARQAYKL